MYCCTLFVEHVIMQNYIYLMYSFSCGKNKKALSTQDKDKLGDSLFFIQSLFQTEMYHNLQRQLASATIN